VNEETGHETPESKAGGNRSKEAAATDPGPLSLKPSVSLDLGAQLYEWRNHTPVLLAILVVAFSVPTARSATIGTFLVIGGEMLRIYSAAYLGTNTRTRSPIPLTEGFMQHGPYAYVRHPIYCGNVLILTGFALYSGAVWLTLLCILGFSFQYYCVAKYEDSVLEENLGEEFTTYRRATPAWIPTRPIRLTELEWPTSWAAAIEAEKRSLAAIALLFTVLLFLA
jgi:protein-S-isoprenylcysteine O-methyltransferase Ste14